MMGKMFLLAIVMILSVSAMILGVVGLLQAHPAFFSLPTSLLLTFGGGGLCLWSVWTLMRLNRQYLDNARTALLSQKNEYLLEWDNDGERIVIARSGVVVGQDIYPFDAFYSMLRETAWDAPDLTFTVRSGIGHRQATRVVTLSVPHTYWDAVPQVIDELENLKRDNAD